MNVLGTAIRSGADAERAVMISDLHERRLRRSAEEIEEITGEPTPCQLCDVTQEGDVQALVRSALHRLRRVEFHPLNWRPNLIIMGGNPNKRAHLLHLGNSIVQDRGIVTYFHLLKGSVTEQAEIRRELTRFGYRECVDFVCAA